MADKYQTHSANAGGNMQNAPVPDTVRRSTPMDLHMTKKSEKETFVPPPMETITGKRMMQEASYPHAQARAAMQPPDLKLQTDSGYNTFVPPSMDMITGQSVMPMESPAMPLAPSLSATPESVQNPYFAAGYLRNYIGREVRVEFLIGSTGALSDRTGTLTEVGASYIVLRPVGTDDLLMCDLFSIKFVTIFR